MPFCSYCMECPIPEWLLQAVRFGGGLVLAGVFPLIQLFFVICCGNVGCLIYSCGYYILVRYHLAQRAENCTESSETHSGLSDSFLFSSFTKSGILPQSIPFSSKLAGLISAIPLPLAAPPTIAMSEGPLSTYGPRTILRVFVHGPPYN